MLSAVRISGAVTGFIDGASQLTATAAGTRAALGQDLDIGTEDGAFNFLNGLAQLRDEFPWNYLLCEHAP